MKGIVAPAFYMTLVVFIAMTVYNIYCWALCNKRIYDFQKMILRLKRSGQMSSALYFEIIKKMYGFNIEITDIPYKTESAIIDRLKDMRLDKVFISSMISNNLKGDDGFDEIRNLINHHIPNSNVSYKSFKDRYITALFKKETYDYKDIAEESLHRVNAKTLERILKTPRRQYSEANPRLFREAKEKFMSEYRFKYDSAKVAEIKSKIPHDHYLRDNPELLVKDLTGPAESLVNEYIERDVMNSDAYNSGGITMVINGINKNNVVNALTAMFLDSLGDVYIARMSYMLGLELGYVHIQNKVILPILETKIKMLRDLEDSRTNNDTMDIRANARSVSDSYIKSFKNLVTSLILSGNLEEFIAGYKELQNTTGIDGAGINYGLLTEKQHIIPNFVAALFNIDFNYNVASLKPNLDRNAHTAIRNISDAIGMIHSREGIIALMAEVCDCTPTYIENVYADSFVHTLVNRKRIDLKLVADGLNFEKLSVINRFNETGEIDASVKGTKLETVFNTAKRCKSQISIDNDRVYVQSGVVSHMDVVFDDLDKPIISPIDIKTEVHSETASKNMNDNKDMVEILRPILGDRVAVDMTKRNPEHMYWNNASFTSVDIAGGVDPKAMSIEDMIKHRTNTIGKAKIYGDDFVEQIDAILNGDVKVDRDELYGLSSKVINDEQKVIIDNAKRQYLYETFKKGGNK